MTDIQPHLVVDRPGTGGRRTALTVEPGRLPQWPIKLTAEVGYGSTITLHLNADEAADLITAVAALAEVEASR